MATEIIIQEQAITAFLSALKHLHEVGILINKKDFTCQIGEWLVEAVYDGKRAVSGIQKGWDVDVRGKHIQVKSHSKAETSNKNRWSALEGSPTEKIDELIILVFTPDYKLKEFYKVPWSEALKYIKLRGKKTKRNEINWSSIKHFEIPIKELPRQEIVSIFSV